jgi:hypothetical protein
MRIIDADALMADIKECIEVKHTNSEYEQLEGLEIALSCVDEQPTIEPLSAREAYIKGLADGIRECTEKLKKLNAERRTDE